MSLEDEKRSAGERAAELVEDGMRVGLGTGSTVSYLLRALAQRAPRATYVATSAQTQIKARHLGLDVVASTVNDRFDLAIDGADQIDADGWLIKGGGGALTREKIVAASSDRFVVIIDSSKLVAVLHRPVPVELLAFALSSTLRRLASARLREGALTLDGGYLADYDGEIGDPEQLASFLSSTPGVIEHGLFPPRMVSDVIVGSTALPHPPNFGEKS